MGSEAPDRKHPATFSRDASSGKFFTQPESRETLPSRRSPASSVLEFYRGPLHFLDYPRANLVRKESHRPHAAARHPCVSERRKALRFAFARLSSKNFPALRAEIFSATAMTMNWLTLTNAGFFAELVYRSFERHGKPRRIGARLGRHVFILHSVSRRSINRFRIAKAPNHGRSC
jgi:hypothetical protein